MYKIDLLQGAGRPPKTRWWQVAIVTLAFMALGGLGAHGYTSYQEVEEQIIAQTRLQQDYQKRIEGLQEVDSFLKQHAQAQAEVQAQVKDLSGVLSRQIQWSPILEAVAQVVPDTVTLSDVMVKRHDREVGTKKSLQSKYTLVIGAITESDHAAIETFVNTLRQSEALQPRLREVRVANQRLREINEFDYLYFVIECQFE